MAAAEKRLRSLESNILERDQRQLGGTVFHQLLGAGVSEEELAARFERPVSTREAGISYMENSPGGAKAVGIAYGSDHKAEEEFGISHIAKNLREGTFEKDDVLLYEKNGFTFMAVRGERSYDWGLSGETSKRAEVTALERHKNWHHWEDRDLKRRLESMSASQVERILAGRVKPLPKTKAAAISAILKLDGSGTSVARSWGISKRQSFSYSD